MRKILFGLLALAIPIGYIYGPIPVFGQAGVNPSGTFVGGFAANRSTKNSSPSSITTGMTFQLILPSNTVSNTVRQRLTVNNNNLTDNCWLFLGVNTGAAVSATVSSAMLLKSGSSYIAEWPVVPSDSIWATCTTTGDILYVDTQ